MLTADKSFSLIVFGASGALARAKIFPSLYEMALNERFEKDFNIIGYSRSELSSEEFRKVVSESVRAKFKDVDEGVLEKLMMRCFYFAGDYSVEEDYVHFKEFLRDVERGQKMELRIAYLAVPPMVVKPILDGLAENLNDKEEAALRLVFEKPFGDDYWSAKKLKKVIFEKFEKEQIFLLDHYLGKEGVFNLLALRYGNPLLSHLLKGEHIANIQISALEPDTLENRAGYFDGVGTLKDMVQSHLFQILAFLTMNVPREFSTELVHNSKINLLTNLFVENDSRNVMRGQYEGYLEEEGVVEGSETETFVALKVKLDVPEWHSIPIFLRTGKALRKKWTGIVIEFKPHENQSKLGIGNLNKLLIEIQPEEKISFYMFTKKGGEEMEFVPLITEKAIYCSGDCLSEHARLFLEVVHGNHLLFLDFKEIYESWRIVDEVKEMLKKGPMLRYEIGGMGPKEEFGVEWFDGV